MVLMARPVDYPHSAVHAQIYKMLTLRDFSLVTIVSLTDKDDSGYDKTQRSALFPPHSPACSAFLSPSSTYAITVLLLACFPSHHSVHKRMLF